MKSADLPSEDQWAHVCSVLEVYWRARSDFVQAEAIVGEYIQPVANEMRNGLDDLVRAIAIPAPKGQSAKLLEDARRHFWRSRCEAFEAVLMVHLARVQQILTSLEREPSARVVQARHWSNLNEAHRRAHVMLVKARTEKTIEPERSRDGCKEAVGIVLSAIEAFMKSEAEFVLASEVDGIKRKVDESAEVTKKWAVWQVALAVILAIGGYGLAIASWL